MKKTFAYHSPSIDALSDLTQIREAFSRLSDLIEQLAPDCRERSIALTNLEQSAMWAIKAIVHNDRNSTAEGMEGVSSN